jgi:hypothetical protein
MFRCYINGRKPPPEGKGLVGALSHFGLNTAGEKYKERCAAHHARAPIQPERDRAGHRVLLDRRHEMPAAEVPAGAYASSRHAGHHVALERVRAVSAVMEHNGVPMDMEIASLLLDKDAWAFARDVLIPTINQQYGVYVQDRAGRWSFNSKLFGEYCEGKGKGEGRIILWPRYENGALDLRRKTFDSMAKAFPQIEALRQLRYTQSQMRKVKLAIGSDGRNRTVLWPFAGKTGRSQPKASEWIFSPAVWLRGLIKPGPGRALAYIDWSGMEFQIAAALSNCKPMLDVYATGIPYIGFAQRFDAAPPDATKKSHPHIHERCKVACLGAQYSMQHVTLAQRLGIDVCRARDAESAPRAVLDNYRWKTGLPRSTPARCARRWADLRRRHHRTQRALDRQLAGPGDRR